MSNTDLDYLYYSLAAKLKRKADELSLDGKAIKEALLVLQEQTKKGKMVYDRECNVAPEIIESLRPIYIVSLSSSRGKSDLFKAADTLIEFPNYPKDLPDYLFEFLIDMGYLENAEESEHF